MRLEQLYYFMEVAHTHSINIAAENLYMTQPALSRAIKAFEDELGLLLFTRSVEGVSLTEHGAMLYPEIKDILQQVVQLQNHANALSAQIQAVSPLVHFNILAFSTLADTVLSPALNALCQQNEHVTYTITNVKLSSFSEQINWSNYDLIVLMDIANLLKPLTDSISLQREELYSENYFLVVHRHHDLAQEKSVTLSEIFHYDVILPQNGLPVQDMLRKLVPNMAQTSLICRQSNNPRIIENALCTQNAVFLSPNTLIKQNFAGNPELCIIPLKNIKGRCFVLYDPNHPHVHFLSELLTYLKAARFDQFLPKE